MLIGRGSCLFVFLFGCVCITAEGRARNRQKYTGVSNTTTEAAWKRRDHLPEDIQVDCQELNAKRYISDGYCTSRRPIREVVCAGHCLPIRELPWFAEFVKYWSRRKVREYQCEEDVVKRKRVKLLCQDGSFRTYKIKVVKSCKCKRTVKNHNRTKQNERRRRRRKQKQKKGKKNTTERKKGQV